MIKTTCTLTMAGKETEQAATLTSVMKNGDKQLCVKVGDISITVKKDAVEAAVSMDEVKRLLAKVDELRYQHQLDLSQITYQRRQIDFLMEGNK